MNRVIIVGAGGRMGRRLVALTLERENMTLAGAVERSDSPLLGQDAGTAAGAAPCGVAVTADLEALLKQGADTIICFATGQILPIAELAVKYHCAAVIGSTTLTAEDRTALRQLGAAGGKLVVSGNMSLGINYLMKLVKDAAGFFGPEYNIEIVEMHHNQKIDAPSGTARMLGETAAAARAWQYEEAVKNGRAGVIGKRPEAEIGMHSLRGGDVVGDHTVIFAAPGERLELTHRAGSRDMFAKGALKAADFLFTAAPGFYDMQDVLGLK